VLYLDKSYILPSVKTIGQKLKEIAKMGNIDDPQMTPYQKSNKSVSRYCDEEAINQIWLKSVENCRRNPGMDEKSDF